MSTEDDADDGGHRTWRARLRDGDVDAYAELFRAHAGRVHRLAASLCQDSALAEEVAGEVFLVAWRQRTSIADSDEPVLPWLLAIAARQSLNVTRSRRRARGFLARQARRPVDAVPDIADAVSARLDDADEIARTRDALPRLRAMDLEVLSLCVWSGLATGEVARLLGISEATVRSRLSRARARLRTIVDEPVGRSPDPSGRATPVPRPASLPASRPVAWPAPEETPCPR